jgi:predicted  nucleic acid-binding Zn-ribbon protein
MILQCVECQNPFEPNKHWQKYCSRECNQAAYLRRKIAKKKADQLDVLLSPAGPSMVQEAEWERRTTLANQFNEQQRLEDEAARKAKAEAVVRKMEELQEKSVLENWMKDKP